MRVYQKTALQTNIPPTRISGGAAVLLDGRLLRRRQYAEIDTPPDAA
jgi:hypothetical protein